MCKWKQLSKIWVNKNKDIPPTKQHAGFIKAQIHTHRCSIHTQTLTNETSFPSQTANSQTFIHIQSDAHFHTLLSCFSESFKGQLMSQQKWGLLSRQPLFCAPRRLNDTNKNKDGDVLSWCHTVRTIYPPNCQINPAGKPTNATSRRAQN